MKFLYVLCSFLLLVNLSTQAQTKAKAALPDTAKKASPKVAFADKIKGSKKIEGLFTFYQDTATGSLLMYVRKDQLGREFIYQSFSLGGPTELFLNQNMIRTTLIFKIEKKYDKINFSEVNTNFYYDSTNAVSKSANVDVAASTFYADKVASQDDDGYLVSVDALLLSEKLDQVKPLLPPGLPPGAVFNLGNLNFTKSGYEKVRSYPDNTDVIVDLEYDNPAPYNGGGKDITDARYSTIRMQHSFLAMPVNDFRPRMDDPRIGYFSEEVDNLTSISTPNYRDIIHRWNLKKKDPTAALSEPVEPIVWWVENTTPLEYRATIVEAGLKWNEAFEKAGYKNAVVMKIMPDTATWDPADVRYNVIRWVSSSKPSYGAIGPSFVNPRTGQILGADITVEWFSGSATPIFDELYGTSTAPAPAMSKNYITCNIGTELKQQFVSGLTTLETMDAPPAEISEMHKEFLYFLVLHEMGHTMGLNHNMKASIMLNATEVNDKSITRVKGLQGSVMDYPAINVSLDHSKQGDYYTTKTGPYDWWAIEYGYKECAPADEQSTLNKILVRSTEPQLAFGNDADDMRSPGGGGIDPRVMVNDMSSDMVAYADDRFKLVNILMGKLKEKYSKPDKSYMELRNRYGTLNGQRFSMAQAVSRYIGGVYVDRSFPGQNATVKPFTPVPAAYQKKALTVLGKYVFAPDAFDADSKLIPYLQAQRRGYNFFGTPEDPKPQNTVLSIQTGVLQHLLSANTMQRINSSGLYGNTYSLADVMNDLTKSIFTGDKPGTVNLYRQNLQTYYIKSLAKIVDAGVSPYDDPSKAASFYTLKKIRTMLATAVSADEQTKAHRANLIFLIDKALVVK